MSDVQPIQPSRHVRVQGFNCAVYERGKSGPLILFIHGMPVHAQVALPLMDALAGSARCVAIDLPGMGKSEWPGAGTMRYDNLLPWLDAVVKELMPEPFVLAVHDISGQFGIPWAVANPNKVSGLVIMNTTVWPELDHLPFTLRPFLAAGLRHLLRPIQRAALQKGLMAMELKKMFGREPRLPAARLDLFWEPFVKGHTKDAFLDWVWTLPSSQEWMRQQNQALPAFPHPVQLVWGMKDGIFREDSIAQFQRQFQQATVARIADASHFVQYEAAADIAAVLGPWLGGLGRKG